MLLGIGNVNKLRITIFGVQFKLQNSWHVHRVFVGSYLLTQTFENVIAFFFLLFNIWKIIKTYKKRTLTLYNFECRVICYTSGLRPEHVSYRSKKKKNCNNKQTKRLEHLQGGDHCHQQELVISFLVKIVSFCVSGNWWWNKTTVAGDCSAERARALDESSKQFRPTLSVRMTN